MKIMPFKRSPFVSRSSGLPETWIVYLRRNVSGVKHIAAAAAHQDGEAKEQRKDRFHMSLASQ
ncbi:hypothetical protein RABR111495_19255 [Rahnella bruchi]